MKRLDEVIDAMERCIIPPCFDCKGCPYEDDDAEVGCRSDDMDTDALHYLKVLKDILDPLNVKKSCEITCPQCNSMIATLLPESNEPLTWDELRQMEGKPVWVEVLSDEIDLSSRWMLVARETKAHSLPLAYTDDIGHWIFGHEDKLGKIWQAYRKERNETN